MKSTLTSITNYYTYTIHKLLESIVWLMINLLEEQKWKIKKQTGFVLYFPLISLQVLISLYLKFEVHSHETPHIYHLKWNTELKSNPIQFNLHSNGSLTLSSTLSASQSLSAQCEMTLLLILLIITLTSFYLTLK